MDSQITPPRNKQIIICFWIFLVFLLGLFFVWGAFTVKKQIFPYYYANAIYSKISGSKSKEDSYSLDKLWAGKIKDGGYILHFRHAQREKWEDVAAFDAFELYSKIDASKSSFSRATCLTDQGIEESRLIGKIFEINGVKISKVVSSPSCRARQTALYAFQRIDAVSNSLLHRPAMMKDQWGDFSNQLLKLFLTNTPSIGTNIVFSGHASTLQYDGKKIFKEDQTSGGIDERKETGFVVIENVQGNLYARHKFNSIKDYVNASLKLPIE